MNERAIDRVMEAMARFMDKPANPARANAEFMEVLDEDWREALLDWEEDKQRREREVEDRPIEWRQTA